MAHLNFCHNKQRPIRASYKAQSGWHLTVVDGVEVRIPIAIEVPDRGSISCKYDKQESDPMCKDCKHIGINYDEESA